MKIDKNTKILIGGILIMLILVLALKIGSRDPAIEHRLAIKLFDESGEEIAAEYFSVWKDPNAFEGLASARILDRDSGGEVLHSFELQVVREADPNSLKETEARIRKY